MKDFSKLLIRASQMHLLMTGKIGISDKQEDRILELSSEKETGINANGNKVKWTDNKEIEINKLINAKNDLSLPKTMQNQLRSIHRAETFNRNFIFTNKYLKKGIDQEDEAITNLLMYFMAKKVKAFFGKNDKRLRNNYFQGEPDINPFQYKGMKCGFDTKCSWNLETFPFEEDKLDSTYEYQNQTYMDLTDSEMWITAYVLVNCTEYGLHNEKMKHFNALGMPGDANHRNWDELIEKYKDAEKMLVFDYDRFIELNPYHQMEFTRKEWMEQELDIPLKNRVVLKESHRNEKVLAEMRERVKAGRKYLEKLNNQI